MWHVDIFVILWLVLAWYKSHNEPTGNILKCNEGRRNKTATGVRNKAE